MCSRTGRRRRSPRPAPRGPAAPTLAAWRRACTGDANAGTGTGTSVAVDGVALTGADAGNYTIVVSGSTVADILRRAIMVTADALSRPEGAADPALTYGITQGSLVAGDALSGGLAREAGEAAGEYRIGQDTLSASANYQLSFVGATLSIVPVAVDPTAGPARTDDMGGVVRFLDGGAGRPGDRATVLEIVDQRGPCDPAARTGECGAGRPD